MSGTRPQPTRSRKAVGDFDEAERIARLEQDTKDREAARERRDRILRAFFGLNAVVILLVMTAYVTERIGRPRRRLW